MLSGLVWNIKLFLQRFNQLQTIPNVKLFLQIHRVIRATIYQKALLSSNNGSFISKSLSYLLADYITLVQSLNNFYFYSRICCLSEITMTFIFIYYKPLTTGLTLFDVNAMFYQSLWNIMMFLKLKKINKAIRNTTDIILNYIKIYVIKLFLHLL